MRVLPEVTPLNEHFFRAGADGVLRILRCARCATFVHPPVPVCPACLGRELKPEAVSGRGTVKTFTLNYQPWFPNEPVPWVIAIVELPEQQGLQVLTNIVNCLPGRVAIGMSVRVVFEKNDDVYLPLFEPREPCEPSESEA